MFATGIFLFLLGTHLGETTSIKSEVKYEGESKIKISEHIVAEPISLPGIGMPPYMPSFIHQGSNYFFNSQIIIPAGPPIIEQIVTSVERKTDDLSVDSKPILDPLIEIVPVNISADFKPIEQKPTKVIGENLVHETPIVIEEIIVQEPPRIIEEVIVQEPPRIFEEIIFSEPPRIVEEIIIPEPPQIIEEVIVSEPVIEEIINSEPPKIIEEVFVPGTIVIPEAPFLPAMPMPELPLPMPSSGILINEPETIRKPPQLVEEIIIPEPPTVEEIIIPGPPTIVEEIIVPEPPKIAEQIIIPEPPQIIEEVIVSEPVIEEIINSEPPKIIEEVFVPGTIVIPEAPVLPAMPMPELPLPMPSSGILINEPEIIREPPQLNEEIIIPGPPTVVEEIIIPGPPTIVQEIIVPEPPKLVEEIIIPEPPRIIEEVFVSKPVIEEIIVPEPPKFTEEIIIQEPIVEEIILSEPPRVTEEVFVSGSTVLIPEAPVLPAMPMPDLPLHMSSSNIFINVPENIVIETANVPNPPVSIEEIYVKINEIPPPPELPPIFFSEIPKPTFVEEKQVVLIPSAPKIIPPPVLVGENPILPTICAQNIVLERVIPNVMFKNTKRLELISIPATRNPVVTINVFK